MRYHNLILLLISSVINNVDGKNYRCNSTASCGCSSISSNSISQRIVGGEIVEDRVWGWMISLQFLFSHVCGASLINPEFAITAAHCVDSYASAPSIFSVVAGVNNLSKVDIEPAQRGIVQEIFIHPDYDSSTNNFDIALIRFTPLNTDPSSTLSFICLPTAAIDEFIDGEDLIATGWGVIVEGSAQASEVLRQVTVQAIPSNDTVCINAPNRDPTIKFCAGIMEGGKDTCQGDSGGPLMSFANDHWVLSGITSSGQGCARPYSPGLYTRVSYFVPYIESIINSSYSKSTTPTSPSTTDVNNPESTSNWLDESYERK